MDLEGFEAFYATHRALVRRVAFSVGGAQDLDDIVQEAFVRMWKGLQGFRQASSQRTWVYRVALNTARDHWRKRSRYRGALARLFFEPPPAAAPPPQAAWSAQRRLALGLEGLSPEQREAVTLCYLEGLSVAEAAEAAGAPEGTIKSRLHHAKARLAEALKGEGDD